MYRISLFKYQLIALQLFLTFLLLIQYVNSSIASDIQNEQYWKRTISENLKIGEPIELKAGEQPFFGIYTKQNRLKQRGSAIIIHGKAEHPNWNEVIRPLRTQLADYGWNTLSIQMPIRNKPLKTKEDIEKFNQQGTLRLDNTLVYLKDKKTPSIFLITHGENAEIALSYIKDNPKHIIDGLVFVSMPLKMAHKQKSIELLELLVLPVLDIYAGKDLETVTLTAKERHSAAKRGGNADYLQQCINNADFSYDNQVQTLIKRVHSWMLSTSGGE
jgi:hypothetical protein